MEASVDHYTNATIALALNSYQTALSHLDKATPSHSVQFLRAHTLLALGKFAQAVDHLESLLSDATLLEGSALKIQTRTLYGKALFMNGEYQRALIELHKVKDILSAAESPISDETEKKELLTQIQVHIRKVELEMAHTQRVGNINDAAYIVGGEEKKSAPQQIEQEKPVQQVQKSVPVIDKKYDWYQNATHVFLSFKVNDPQVSKDAKVDFTNNTVTIQYPDININLTLAHDIIPDQSTTTATPKKIEIKLKKITDNVNWMAIEKGGETKLLATVVPSAGAEVKPSYPTSSKNKKDWSKVDKDIEKEMAGEKPEGDAALNSLFKQIYERADENTRRAMIKSYQTSGGTVLSTNWEEVAAKDYEGKDRPDAPEGQQWAK